MKWLDLPPLWLAFFILLTLAIARLVPGLTVDFAWAGVLALILFLAGLVLMGLAAWEMARRHTTIIPHRQPDALVTGGVFRLSRNPIYLGDMLVLLGVIAWTGAILALPLVWIFKRVIETRFIIPEESRLKQSFGAAYEDWTKITRRWV